MAGFGRGGCGVGFGGPGHVGERAGVWAGVLVPAFVTSVVGVEVLEARVVAWNIDQIC